MTRQSVSKPVGPPVVDNYTFDGFIKSYRERTQRELGSLIQCREGWPNHEFKLVNPPLKRNKDGSYSPDFPSRCLIKRHFHFANFVEPGYFHTLQATLSEFEGSFGGHNITFTVPTDLRFYHEFKKKVGKAERFSFDFRSKRTSRNRDIWQNADCDVITVHPARQGLPIEIHQSDTYGWNSRLTLYRVAGTPYGFFNDFEPRLMHLPDVRETDADLGLTNYDLELSGQSVLRLMAATLGQVVDMSLIAFLLEREIPVLSVIHNQNLEEISDVRIQFLDKHTHAMRDLYAAWPHPFSEFLLNLFEGTREWLADNDLLRECGFCRRLFRFDSQHPSKLYCSPLAEGRDCGKAVRNRRSYGRHADKWRSYSREEMRKNREYERRLIRESVIPSASRPT